MRRRCCSCNSKWLRAGSVPTPGVWCKRTQDLADICFKAKDYERAEKYHREVLQQVEFWRRPDDALTGFARIGLAKVMRERVAPPKRSTS